MRNQSSDIKTFVKYFLIYFLDEYFMEKISMILFGLFEL